MTPRPGTAPAAIAGQALALRARPTRRQPRHAIHPGDQATSTPTTTDAKWGHHRAGASASHRSHALGPFTALLQLDQCGSFALGSAMCVSQSSLARPILGFVYV